MFGLGFSEIVVIGVLALILLGPEQLPDLARKLGKFVNELKRTTDGLKEEFKNSGINPSNLLEEIKNDRPAKKPNENTSSQNQNVEDMLPPQNPVDILKSGHVENAHSPIEEKNPTGSDDSGKK
jgi:sec-independent protein translocase protein TatB